MGASATHGRFEPLLTVLREHLGEGRLGFRSPPRRLVGGAFSEVLGFELDGAPGPWRGPLVLRTYAEDQTALQPRLEQAVQNGVAAAGFPAPRVLLAHDDVEPFGRRFVVMERLPGRGFLRGVRADRFARDFPKLLLQWPGVLADVAGRLHSIDPAAMHDAAVAHGVPAALLSTRRHLERVERVLVECGDGRTADALAWLREAAPETSGAAVVHGDLWPANVLFHGRRFSGLVDWNVAGIGDPALDIGFAKAGLALLPAPFPPPPPIRGALRAAGRSLARRVEASYAERHPVAPDRVAFYEALRCLHELATVLAFRARAAGGDAPARPPWDRGARDLASHFTAVTGVPLSFA